MSLSALASYLYNRVGGNAYVDELRCLGQLAYRLVSTNATYGSSGAVHRIDRPVEAPDQQISKQRPSNARSIAARADYGYGVRREHRLERDSFGFGFLSFGS